MDIFDKCTRFTRVRDLRAAGEYYYFRRIDSPQDPEVTIAGKKLVMLGSNSYLGLTNHPKVKEAACEAIRKYGTGCAGSRFLNGTLDIHEELEGRLAKFMRKPAAVTFSTGFLTNLGTISALVGKDDVVAIDKLDHASIIDGTRLSFGDVRKFKHNDPADLDRILSRGSDRASMVVVDGVFSMEGDIIDLPGVVKVARKHSTRVMVDDAHGIGVLGKGGRGTAEHFGLEDDVDIIMGTYSKSLASIGGFVVGDVDVIDYIKHHARALIFSASPPPASVASVIAALDIIESEPERRERLWENTRKMQKGFVEMGYDIGVSETPVVPVVVGEDMTAFIMTGRLQELGVFVNPVVSPGTPPGRALIRTSYMATHTDEQLDRVLDIFEKVGKELGILQQRHV
ncbi:MAG: pyridoxal phosphate-dependent aminotransferase family protein [Nitrospirae bacterium]|nr:pyridoxal phosphate-dependent aminotransferase family protein [Nitrospirota bacterium]